MSSKAGILHTSNSPVSPGAEHTQNGSSYTTQLHVVSESVLSRLLREGSQASRVLLPGSPSAGPDVPLSLAVKDEGGKQAWARKKQTQSVQSRDMGGSLAS